MAVYAPYNFVPFSQKVLEYTGDIPAHDAVDLGLKTGEIHVTLTAETPVFVSDRNREEAHFFQGPNGQLMLPGSTIRGMVRNNMQILGFGLVRTGEDVEDQRVFYRKVADARGSTGGELKTYYHTVLAVKSLRSPSGKLYAIPQNVRAGYLRREGNGYVIQPVKGTYFKVSRKHPGAAALGNRPARTVRVAYTAEDGQVKELCPADKGRPDMARGVFLFTGRPINPGMPNRLYLFPEADRRAAPVPISKEDELAYAADWEGRRNSLKVGYDPDFWRLPRGGMEKPVFYVRHDGHVYFGMSLFPRIGYRFSVKEGLPKSHSEKQDRPDFMDWPRAILGYAQSDRSRRSRVSFGDFPAQGSPQEGELVETVLGSPKISYYPGYVVNGEHYNREGFRLRGYKQYWLKESPAAPTGGGNMAAKLRPLPAGTAFSGVIRYKNLRPEELGLLLWALRLEEGCYQSVGMGRPYGFGRMKLAIDSLREYDLNALYTPGGLCEQPPATSEGAIQRYIDAYDAGAVKAMGLETPSITGMGEIQDFFYLHRTIRGGNEAGYMTLRQHRNADRPLPDTASFRRVAGQMDSK